MSFRFFDERLLKDRARSERICDLCLIKIKTKWHNHAYDKREGQMSAAGMRFESSYAAQRVGQSQRLCNRMSWSVSECGEACRFGGPAIGRITLTSLGKLFELRGIHVGKLIDLRIGDYLCAGFASFRYRLLKTSHA